MTLAQFTIGEGPHRSVLLHGFLGQGRNLRTLAQRWSEAEPARSFLLLDLPGHGTSPTLAPTLDLGGVAAAVVDTCRAAGWQEPISFTGHSLGGRVALAVLRDFPAHVADVTLVDIAPGALDTSRGGTRRVAEILAAAPAEAADRATLRSHLIDAGLSPGVSDWLMMNVVRSESGVRWRIDRDWLLAFHQRVGPEDFWSLLEGAHPPVRCIRGGASPYVSEEERVRLESLGVHVTTLPGAGHEVHVEALPELIEALLRPF
jgi:pimeloyl-ACP methyl ester carboxylesterase